MIRLTNKNNGHNCPICDQKLKFDEAKHSWFCDSCNIRIKTNLTHESQRRAAHTIKIVVMNALNKMFENGSKKFKLPKGEWVTLLSFPSIISVADILTDVETRMDDETAMYFFASACEYEIVAGEIKNILVNKSKLEANLKEVWMNIQKLYGLKYKVVDLLKREEKAKVHDEWKNIIPFEIYLEGDSSVIVKPKQEGINFYVLLRCFLKNAPLLRAELKREYPEVSQDIAVCVSNTTIFNVDKPVLSPEEFKQYCKHLIYTPNSCLSIKLGNKNVIEANHEKIKINIPDAFKEGTKGFLVKKETWRPLAEALASIVEDYLKELYLFETLRNKGEVNVVKCPLCGALNVPSNRFCTKCGSYLRQKYCVKCGSPIDPLTSVCPKCGAKALAK